MIKFPEPISPLGRTIPRIQAGRKRGSKRVFDFLLFVFPYLLVAGAITPPKLDNWLPATTLLEFILLLPAAIVARNMDRRARLVFWPVFLYMTIHITIAYLSHSAPLDEIVRAHKWLIYLLCLCLFVGNRLEEPERLIRLTKFFILAAGIKYMYCVAFLGLSARPAILTENNYELFLFMGLLVLTYKQLGPNALSYLSILGLSILISGSRSAAVGFVIVVFYVAFSGDRGGLFRRYMFAIFAAIVTIVPIYVFQQRDTNLDTLDRLNFYNHFAVETVHWHMASWFLGSSPLTQLSSYTCQGLSFYSTLLSSYGDGSCYSVILHSFFLRVVFDFGLIGLSLAYLALWLIMRAAEVPRTIRLVLLLLSVANGISVSGLNNAYVILPVGYAILLFGNQHENRDALNEDLASKSVAQQSLDSNGTTMKSKSNYNRPFNSI